MTTPLCPYFEKCGGCTSQHIGYLTQLENKKAAVAKATGIASPFIFSGKEYGYRNRMDFIFHPSGLGLRKRSQWQSIVNIEQCPISDKKINELLTETRTFFSSPDSFNIQSHKGTFRYAVMRVTSIGDSSISFVLNDNSNNKTEAMIKINAFAAKTSAQNVVATFVPSKTDNSIGEKFLAIKGKDTLREQFLGKTFQYPIQGFFQNNHAMAEEMHRYCRSILEKHTANRDTKPHLLDLYAGVGAFGIINADLFASVQIVENVAPAVECAQQNCRENRITNATVAVLDAAQISRLKFPSPLYVITDPPRSGMHPKTIQHLRAIKPKCIIYISCNVQQLARDIPKFKEYNLASAALFDLFPQTPHSEAVVELILKE